MANACRALTAIFMIAAALAVADGPSVAGPEARPSPASRPASAPAGPATQPAKDTFTVATYNINNMNRDLKTVVRTIRESQADLVCLQETNTDSAVYFRLHLKKEYPYSDFRNVGGHSGLGFLAKRPIQSVKYLPRRFGVHAAWVIQTTVDEKSIEVAAVHLQPAVPRPGDTPEKYLARQAAAEEIRSKEIADIFKQLSRKTPAIVLGDFNSLSNMKAPQFMAEKGFIDSFASVTDKPDEHVTWRSPDEWLPVAFRVDYIFHTTEFKTVASRVIVSDASDHYMVVSKLGWAKGPLSPGATRPATER